MYQFTLHVAGLDPASDSYENALYDAGCGDALIAVVEGHMSLDFAREAPSYEMAVASAVLDVQRAGVELLGTERIEDEEDHTTFSA